MMRIDEEDEDEEKADEDIVDEPKEEESEPEESEESESESDSDSDNESVDSEPEVCFKILSFCFGEFYKKSIVSQDADDEKKKQNYEPRIKRHDGRLAALKKGNLLRQTNLDRLIDEINKLRDDSVELQRDLDSVLSELGQKTILKKSFVLVFKKKNFLYIRKEHI